MEQKLIEGEQTLPNEQNYYRKLKHYYPLWYSGKGRPFFLLNDTYYQSVPCLIFINAVFAILLVMSFLTAQNSNKTEYQLIMIKLDFAALLLIDLSYFLTIAMNPGIVSQSDMKLNQESEIKYCKACERIKVEMTHCNDCEVCVMDLDHHCGFFGRCIAGHQRFAFYAFLLFMFCGFILILAGVTSNLG